VVLPLKAATTTTATTASQGQESDQNRTHTIAKKDNNCTASSTEVSSEFCSSTSSSQSFSSSVVGSRKRKQTDMIIDKKKQSRKADHNSFCEALKRRGLEVVEQDGDGNCLFRAVSLQVYGDSNMHGEVRRRCLDFMAKNEDHFASFITDEPFKDYIHRKRRDGVHGNNPEIQAISELFNRPVEVFDAEVTGEKPINIFHTDYKTADKPIRLSYHDGNHYNAVIDPLCPTAGLGLGLPGLEPGLADRMQMEKAVLLSDIEATDTQLQKTLKESNEHNSLMYKQKALLLSDIEATEFQIDQAVLASSIEASKPSHLRQIQPASIQSSSHATSSEAAIASALSSVETTEYPDTVQELVMNGFELQKVIHAYELIGDNFDQLLSFLLSNSTR